MVTFSLPGDDNVADATNGTPRPRPPLPFAKRNGTRHDMLSSSLNSSSIATAQNIFRASSFIDSPPTTAFSPRFTPSTMKRVFAPGATPEPSRLYRSSATQETPRPMASRAADKELFQMRISSPPPELTGELLTQKIPKDWNSKGSIYADQFLAHLCPPGLDEEQRRQFFCILDLRRLKYAANDIFSRKDWKLNVINFAKEFEKSRSIILLRYGLYEFQNVKPSKEVLKRWRREHGLPEPEAAGIEPSPSKSNAASRKRKADEDLPKDDSLPASSSPLKGKRRAVDREEKEEHQESLAATPAPSTSKRKASVSEDPPTKMQKTMPSSAKLLFEKIANKPAVAAQNLEKQAGPKANPFAANKAGSSSLARSVLTNVKPLDGQGPPAGNNIFGYLSDASSAKNSGAEADAEIESETGSDGDESPEAGHSDEPSTAASGTGETTSHVGFNSLEKKPAPPTSGIGHGLSSNTDTRESTPARSLFDRVTKDSDGQPVRAEEKADAPVGEKPAAPVDQTWNPSTTPIKFAPPALAAQKSSMFGSSTMTHASPAFAPKSTTTANNFGAAAPAKESSTDIGAGEGGKDAGGESDKENESQSSEKALLEHKTPAPQSSVGPSLFQPRPASTEPTMAPEVPKANTNLFGSTTNKNVSKPEATTANMFGTLSKSSNATPAMQSPPFLFGAKSGEAEKPTDPEPPKATPLFGGQGASSTLGNTTQATPSVFGGNKLSTADPPNAFGNSASTSPAPLFSATAAFGSVSAAAKSDGTSSTTEAPSKPMFSFGSTTSGGHKPSAEYQAANSRPLFGASKSPPSDSAAKNMFGGSPMKQDEQSPAKRVCLGGNDTVSSAPAFSFGNSDSATSATKPNTFGGASAPAASNLGNAVPSFGAGSSSNSGSGGFNFNFNAGGATGSTFNNPFAKDSGSLPGASTGGAFSFGGNSSAPAGASSSPFQFGGAARANTSTPAASGLPVFGGSQPANGNPTPMFGGASASGSGVPVFNFSGTSSSQPLQGTGSGFGTPQAAPAFGASLQAPAGGSSTTGTTSPLYLGGGSSLATTPAAGTPEPSSQGADEANGDGNDEEEKHKQANLLDGADEAEEVLHEVRAKAMKFVPLGDKSGSDGKSTSKSKSPWSTQGVGPLRLLKHEERGSVRLVLRAEPRGHVVLNRALLPNVAYRADEKYVKVTTSNEKGDGLETWMLQVKTKDSAEELAEALEKNKGSK